MESSAERPHHKGAFVSVHQPSSAPGPVVGNRINEYADKDSIDQIHGELSTFRHGSGHDGGRRGAEYSLENQEAFDGQSVVDAILSIASKLKKWGAPTKPPMPNISPKPMNQNRMEPNMKSTRFFISTLAVFLVRMNPASHEANPGCMKNTNMAASSIHTVLSPVASSPRPRRLHRRRGGGCHACILRPKAGGEHK